MAERRADAPEGQPQEEEARYTREELLASPHGVGEYPREYVAAALALADRRKRTFTRAEIDALLAEVRDHEVS
jgi:hypothetical protein